MVYHAATVDAGSGIEAAQRRVYLHDSHVGHSSAGVTRDDRRLRMHFCCCDAGWLNEFWNWARPQHCRSRPRVKQHQSQPDGTLSSAGWVRAISSHAKVRMLQQASLEI